MSIDAAAAAAAAAAGHFSFLRHLARRF